MFSGAPRTLVVLLGLVLAVQLGLSLLAPGSLILPLLKVALLAFFMMQVLQGKESAAKVLAILMLLGAVLDGLALADAIGAGSVLALALFGFAAFKAVVAGYLLMSQQVRQFLAQKAYPG